MLKNIDLDHIDITKTPPTEEVERQYYFMAKARCYVKEQSEKLSRPLNAAVVTFGCEMNFVTTIAKTA